MSVVSVSGWIMSCQCLLLWKIVRYCLCVIDNDAHSKESHNSLFTSKENVYYTCLYAHVYASLHFKYAYYHAEVMQRVP